MNSKIMLIVSKVQLYKETYVFIYLTEESIILSDERIYKPLGLKDTCTEPPEVVYKNGGCRFKTNAYFLQPFAKTCSLSPAFRQNVIENVCIKCFNHIGYLKLILEPPDYDIIDYSWNHKVAKLLWTRVEVENAFSWLSTLGGAYSALGDYFDHCAEEAGRISIRQYKLSKILGDDGLAARSRLYSALSLSQKGQLKLARHIVRNVHSYGRETKDRRLVRMCQGVWAKLRYLRGLRRRLLPSKEAGDGSQENGKCSP